jgi:flagellar basal body-associated protein FliL
MVKRKGVQIMKKNIQILFLFIIICLISSSCSADEIDKLLKEVKNFYNNNDLPELVAQMEDGNTNQKIQATTILTRYFTVMEKLEENEANMSANQLEKYLLIGNKATENLTTLFLAYSLINKGGTPQTVVIEPETPYVGIRPMYNYFNELGLINTNTKDNKTVNVDILIGYDLDDQVALAEFTNRIGELRNSISRYFNSKNSSELSPEKEMEIKQEILEQLNIRVLNNEKIKTILFNRLDIY